MFYIIQKTDAGYGVACYGGVTEFKTRDEADAAAVALAGYTPGELLVAEIVGGVEVVRAVVARAK